MKIGISRPEVPTYPTSDIDGALVAVHAEQLGFDVVFYGEHTVRPVEQVGVGVHTDGVPQFQDTLVMLARTSAMTSRITFGGGIFLLPQHNPFRFAKELACLDLYSGGRLIVGGGVGWSRVECELLGGDYDRRWAQSVEAIAVMRALWTEPVAEFHGEFFSMPPTQCFPAPATAGGPPILLAGKSERALRRIVACAEGWIPSFVTPEAIEDGPAVIEEGRRRLDVLAAEAGRTGPPFQIAAILRGRATRQLVARYDGAGTDIVAISLPKLETLDEARRELDSLAGEVLPD